jgi:hypothetical protein
MATVRAGFAKADLSPCISHSPGFRRPLEARSAVFEDAKTVVALVALDLIEIAPVFCRQLREEVAAKLGIAPQAVLIHSTHTHTAPWDQDHGSSPAIPGLGRVIADCCAKARAGALPARMRVGATDVGQTLSIRRRGDAGPDLGLQTFWFGYTYRDGDDRPDASALASEMRNRWLRQPSSYKPADKPLWFDRPVDPLVQAMSFETMDAKPLGSIARFCAHPHCASSCHERLFDPDYPAVVRDVVERSRGGTCLFLLGPSADLAPKERVRYTLDESKVPPFPFMGTTSAYVPESDAAQLAELKRIGTAVADAALKGLAGAAAQPLQRLAAAHCEQAVPIDPALPTDRGAIQRIKAALVPQYEAFLGQGGPPREMRGLANRLNWLEWAAEKALTVLTPQDRARGAIQMPLAAVRLNDTAMAFMHSEVSMETTLALRQASANLWTVGLTGGSIEYVPTAAMIDEGGYEGRSTVVARDAESQMRSAVEKMLRELV